uniref:Chromatin modification-related protein MEAF6 n=1 Tax=Setaria italica TaxID=4555 RepID=K3YWF4_SETIT
MDSGGGGGSGAHKAASGSAPSPAQPAPNPTAMLSVLMSKRAKLQEELRSIERQVYDMETTYLQESNQFGSVLKGFESFLSSSKNTSNLKRSRKFQADERLFSLSSVTSPAVQIVVLNVAEQHMLSKCYFCPIAFAFWSLLILIPFHFRCI